MKDANIYLARLRTKTPSFTRSDTFIFSYRIFSFCLKTTHFNPARSVVMVRILHRFSENGDYQQGKKWCKWRVFDPYWTATIISGISNGNTHVHFLIPRIESLDNVSECRTMMSHFILRHDLLTTKERFQISACYQTIIRRQATT